jgi:hypothetical protein
MGAILERAHAPTRRRDRTADRRCAHLCAACDLLDAVAGHQQVEIGLRRSTRLARRTFPAARLRAHSEIASSGLLDIRGSGGFDNSDHHNIDFGFFARKIRKKFPAAKPGADARLERPLLSSSPPAAL